MDRKGLVEHLRQKFSTEDTWDKEMLARELSVLEKELMALTPVLVGGKTTTESITDYVERGRTLQYNALARYKYIKRKLETQMESTPAYGMSLYTIDGANSTYVLATSAGQALSKVGQLAKEFKLFKLKGSVTIGELGADAVVYKVVTKATSFVVTHSYDNLMDILKTPEYSNVQSIKYLGSVVV